MSGRAREVWEPRIDRALWFLVCAHTFFLPSSITFAQAALVGMLVCQAARVVLRRRVEFHRDPLFLPLAAFLAATALSVAFSVDPARSLRKSAESLWIVPAYFVVRGQLDGRSRRAIRLFQILALVAGLVAIYGIAQSFFGWDRLRLGGNDPRLFNRTEGYYHATGFFDHHLTYGNSLMMSLFANAALFFAPISRRWKWALVPLTALALTALFFSYARGPLLGLAAGGVVYGYLKGRRALVAMVATGVVLGTLFYLSSPTLRSRIDSAFAANKNVERIIMWQTTVSLVRDHPLLGTGPGTYREVIWPYRTGYNVTFTSAAHAHNLYLQIAATHGLIALAALIWLFVRLLAGAILRCLIPDGDPAHREPVLGAVAGLAAFCFAGLFQYNLGDAEVAMLMWLFAAVALHWPSGADGREGVAL